MKRFFFSLPLLVLCAACASTSTPAPQPQQQSAEPQVATLEAAQGPAECTRTINQFQNIISADVGTGSLDRNVFPRIASDLGPVRAVCASGDSAAANRELAAVKKKYGYR